MRKTHWGRSRGSWREEIGNGQDNILHTQAKFSKNILKSEDTPNTMAGYKQVQF